MPTYQKKDEHPQSKSYEPLAIDKIKEFNGQYKKRKLDPSEDISQLSLSDLDPE